VTASQVLQAAHIKIFRQILQHIIADSRTQPRHHDLIKLAIHEGRKEIGRRKEGRKEGRKAGRQALEP
jgi:hypothetical protein